MSIILDFICREYFHLSPSCKSHWDNSLETCTFFVCFDKHLFQSKFWFNVFVVVLVVEENYNQYQIACVSFPLPLANLASECKEKIPFHNISFL